MNQDYLLDLISKLNFSNLVMETNVYFLDEELALL